MRLVWFFPLTYVAGIDGFGWFVPYLLLVGAVATALAYARHRHRFPRLVKVRSVPRELLKLEAAPA